MFEESEEVEELDHTVEDEQICDDCYEKNKDEDDSWEETSQNNEEDERVSDLTITCDGCDREIEFGYSHPGEQGRIFLGEDDSDFNPWKTFPNLKYVEKWRARGWLRPMKVEEAAKHLKLSIEDVRKLIEDGTLPRHPKAKGLATDWYAAANYQATQTPH